MSENESYDASYSEGEGNESLEDNNVTEALEWIESFEASHGEGEWNESMEDGNVTEAFDWFGVGLGVMEVGLAEGSLLGRVELHRLNAQNGMYKGLEIAAGLE